MNAIDAIQQFRAQLMLGLLLAIGATNHAGAGEWVHPFELPQPPNAPNRLLAVVEIPAGAQAKYEIDPTNGNLVVDRLLKSGWSYPVHYGALPSVYAADGDLLDVLIITSVDLVPGAVIEVLPIGLARMLDGGLRDDKILAIPAQLSEAGSDGVASLSSVNQAVLSDIQEFFLTYKADSRGVNPIEWQGYLDRDAVLDGWDETELTSAQIKESKRP